ncbi:polypyrimidine tract-binding protein [Thraustotheca clavata]|uniref:Polypyrimidine tract-binding protein n=1 Tax=Thraustotheca clavata TaxID=74557 RepID=A0A1V9YLB6_9STRA|nr:polypyrimidine tract-binding protein [Thraustotheca clavata]
MNGAKRSAPTASETPEMKRQRHEENQFVSRVVFARGLPDDCLESELMALCIPFSSVEKCLLIPSKNQAFIELPDTTAASSLISFYQAHDAMVRGKKIFFAFSSRGEIFPQKPGDVSDSPRRDPRTRRSDRSKERSDSRTRSQPRNSQPQPRDRSQPRQAPFSAPPEPYYPYQQQPTYESNPPTYGEQGQRNSILMVTISKLEYDVNVDILHQVFQSHGNVVKIVTFFKGNEFKALVQMQTVEQAEAAQQALNGRDIYTGCNTLHIVVSNHLALNVRYNNDQTRDYTNPNLPRGPEQQWEAAAPRGMLGDGPRFNQSAPPPANNNNNRSGRRSRSQSRERRDRRERRDSREFNRDGGRMPAPNAMNPRDFGPPRDFGRDGSRPNEYPRSPVLICSNVDKRFMKVQSLFSFFGCFGDVMRIKIMFRKEGTSLVQFFNEDHAQSARKYLDGVVICGKKLRVDFSKHTAIIMPRSDAEEFEIINTVDFSNSPHHRYRRRSLTEAAPPSPLLHISGIPSSMQPREYEQSHPIAAMFVNYGLVKKFHPIQKQPKMALVEMASLEEAIDSLIALDNYVFPDGRIRVSFSKSASRS